MITETNQSFHFHIVPLHFPIYAYIVLYLSIDFEKLSVVYEYVCDKRCVCMLISNSEENEQ